MNAETWLEGCMGVVSLSAGPAGPKTVGTRRLVQAQSQS